MSNVRASVAMAVYNGEKYICEQIDSILQQLGPLDELVISYDRSQDGTKAIIDDYAGRDSRVRVLENRNPGVQNNFNNAVLACEGTYIFLSDQDDVWVAGKLQRMLEVFEETDADMVTHDAYIVDENLAKTGKTLTGETGTATGPVHNIIKGTFWGCCMAFHTRLRPLVCPFPNKNAVGHDIWIGILAGFYGKVVRIPDLLLLHRIHGNNVTVSRRKLTVVARHRISLVGYLCARAIKNIGKQ